MSNVIERAVEALGRVTDETAHILALLTAGELPVMAERHANEAVATARAALAELRRYEVVEGEIDYHSPPDDGQWVAFWNGFVEYLPGHVHADLRSPAILLVEKQP
jgi:hypothetical protein